MENIAPGSLIPVRILIVDDHPNTASMLARVLGKFDTPVEVVTASSAEDGLAKVGENNLEILITDFMMSGMNGLDLIEKLKSKHRSIYTILITAYDTPGLRISAKQINVNNYLVKPVQPEKLREIVSNVLKEIRPLSAVSSSAVHQQRPFKILVADDNPDNVRLLSVRLKSEGYEYVLAYDGQEALDKIRLENPDLVLLDVNMPRKDGFEVLIELRADNEIAHIPVIIITAARIAAKDVREGLTLGADDYITKPVDWRELSARIRTKLRVKQAEDTLRNRTKELSVLPELSMDLGERLDVEELTNTILSRSVNALNASNGYLVIYSPDGTINLQMFKAIDISPMSWEVLRPKILSEGIIPQLIASQEETIITDVNDDDRWVKIPNNGTRSAILIPLPGRRDVLGVLVIMSEQPGYFSQEHLRLLRAISSQSAIAIENAQLFAIERKRVNELVALNQLTHQISRSAHSEDIFDNITSWVKQQLGYPCVAFWLKKDEKLYLKRISGETNAPRRSLLELAPQQAAETGGPIQFSGPVEERTGIRFGVGTPPVMSAVAVPITWAGCINGVLSIHSQRSSAFQESDRVLLETLAAQMGLVLERINFLESVEQEQKRLLTVLNNAADAILVVNPQGQLQLINPAGEKLFTDFQAQLGNPLPANKGYDELATLIEKARTSMSLEKSEIRWPDSRTFSVLVAPIEEGGQVAVLHDVSHFLLLNQLKNDFIATASHDLKNPISAVLGFSDLLSKAGTLNELQTDFVRRIKGSALQMHDLVLNMLEMARIEMETNGKKEKVNINEMLTELFEEYSPQAQAKGLSFQIELCQNSVFVSGDRTRLQQLVRNLLGNAMKYTLSGGQIFLSEIIENSKIHIKVKDTGFGIPEESIPHLFEKFFRVSSEATQDIEGNGLGLAIVRSIADQHGGEVKVDSIEGKGSCFDFIMDTMPE